MSRRLPQALTAFVVVLASLSVPSIASPPARPSVPAPLPIVLTSTPSTPSVAALIDQLDEQHRQAELTAFFQEQARLETARQEAVRAAQEAVAARAADAARKARTIVQAPQAPPPPSLVAACADAGEDPTLDARGYARAVMAACRGWVGQQWACLDQLWTRESSWNHLADNPGSDAYGIPQALPGSKMAVDGEDWATNPRTQVRWGLRYIGAKHGTPCGAWAAFLAQGWY